MSDAQDREQNAEVLISRVVDGEATARDWQAFTNLADRDPTLWREMAEYQHDHAEMTAMVAAAIEIADEVEAPTHVHMEQSMMNRLRLVAAWGGWAAAAAVGMMWMVAKPFAGSRSAPPVQGAGVLSPSQFLQGYIERGMAEGRVVGELPDKLLVQTRPADSGKGFEVIFIRQIVERANVEDLYTFGTNEAGQPVPVRVQSVTPVDHGPM